MFKIQNLIDDAKCYETVRELRWPDGVKCPHCLGANVIKRGFDEGRPDRRRYFRHDCGRRFDDLTNTVFSGRHQPLKAWNFVRRNEQFVTRIKLIDQVGLMKLICPGISDEDPFMKTLRNEFYLTGF